jgi:hypothetical protein
MNIFTKAEITRALTIKVKEGEIRSFLITDTHLRIQKSKRTGFTINLSELSDKSLIRIIKKTTPNPSIENIENFYRKEIRNIKLIEILNGIK